MRMFGSRGRVLAGALVAGAALAALPMGGGGGSAWAQGAPASEAAPKQVALSQKSIDGLVAAQKQIRDAEAKMPTPPQGQEPAPDPKMEAKVEGIAKANGFASMGDFADASYSVGMVLAGMDPQSGTYIGTQAALKKQIAEVQADKAMPANEKKEALNELDAAMKDAPADKPLPGNISIVKANLSKLSDSTQSGD